MLVGWLKIFGPNVAKSVMEGGNYIRGKRGISMIAEAIECLQISAFLDKSEKVDMKVFSKASFNTILV